MELRAFVLDPVPSPFDAAAQLQGFVGRRWFQTHPWILPFTATCREIPGSFTTDRFRNTKISFFKNSPLLPHRRRAAGKKFFGKEN